MTSTKPAAVPEPRRYGPRITGPARTKLIGELAKKYTDGASIRALAEETGYSYGFVHRLLHEGDVQVRGQGGPRHHKAGR